MIYYGLRNSSTWTHPLWCCAIRKQLQTQQTHSPTALWSPWYALVLQSVSHVSHLFHIFWFIPRMVETCWNIHPTGPRLEQRMGVKLPCLRNTLKIHFPRVTRSPHSCCLSRIASETCFKYLFVDFPFLNMSKFLHNSVLETSWNIIKLFPPRFHQQLCLPQFPNSSCLALGICRVCSEIPRSHASMRLITPIHPTRPPRKPRAPCSIRP